MDSNTFITAFLGNSLSFCPGTFWNMYSFLTPRECLGVWERKAVEGAMGSWVPSPFPPSRQCWVIHTQGQPCLDSPGPIFFSVGCGKSVVPSVEAEDGKWEENLAFQLKRGQKAKGFFADHSGFISFHVVKGRILSSLVNRCALFPGTLSTLLVDRKRVETKTKLCYSVFSPCLSMLLT